MRKLSAFISMNAMNVNLLGVTSPIGELSSYATTFSREVGKYGKVAYPDVFMHSFDSKLDDVHSVVPDAMVSKILAMGQFLFNTSIDGSLSDNKESCQQAITAEFATDLEVLTVGAMETNGVYWLPTYVFFKVLGSDNLCRVWFSDPAFRAQYDINEIMVIPPVIPMDDLHKERAIALAKLDGISIHDMITREGILTGEIPETKLHTVEYDWVDKNDPSIRVPTPFMVAIYGASGINDDLIRQALIDHILANSAFDRDEWEKIFPDLFRPTEFYIGPIWDRYSLPNNTISAGLFSPVFPIRDTAKYAGSFFPAMDKAYLDANVATSTTVFKGLAFIAIGNPRNRGNLFRFEDLWPNYINLSTNHSDFDRIPPLTQKFIIKLITMLETAENLTEYSEIPTGMTRITREGIRYLASSYNKVMYLVALKVNPVVVPAPEVPGPQ